MAVPAIAFIALGANLGDAAVAVQQAMEDIAHLPLTQVLARSSLYQSSPLRSSPSSTEPNSLTVQQTQTTLLGKPSPQDLGGSYINAVVKVQTQLGAIALLQALQNLEKRAGRERTYQDAPRLLDLDLLLYGSLCVCTPQLQLPHPRMNQRAFVLWPLQEIAPERVDTTGLERLKIQQNICLYSPAPAIFG